VVEKIRSFGYHPSSAFPHLTKQTYYTYTYTPSLPQPLTLFTVLNTLRAETNPVRLAIFGFTEIETGASLPGEDVRLLLTGLAVPRANDRSILQDTPIRTTYHLYIFIPCTHASPADCILCNKSGTGQGPDCDAKSCLCRIPTDWTRNVTPPPPPPPATQTRSSSLPHFRQQRC
jgi:hypothetical protein